MPQNGWNVVSTAPAPKLPPPAQSNGGWNVVSTAPVSPPQHPAPAPAGNVIRAYNPGFGERLMDTVRNGAIGTTLEQEFPKVADALNMHPTATVNNPTYQSDRQQLIAPQYLVPAPKSAAAHVARGVLRGTGQLTSAPSLATGVVAGATGGMVSPLAPTAVRAVMAGTGAANIYNDASRAYSQWRSGDAAGAQEAAGAALPNAALTLPALGKPIEGLGNFLQDRGADLMDSYLKTGKRDVRYGAEPGRSVLQQGPGTSVGFTRQGFADNVDAARDRVGTTIPAIVNASQASIPRADMRSGVDAVFGGKASTLNGVGGNPNAIAPLDGLRQTFAPLVDTPGSASVPEVYAAKRNVDQNINWGRGIDPITATMNNARREARAALAGELYKAAPELQAPSQAYSGLAAASKLATDRTMDQGTSFLSPLRLASVVGSGLTAQTAMHNPELSIGTGLITGALPAVAQAPIVKTGGATALYQAGRSASAAGRFLAQFPASSSGAGAEDQTYDGENGVARESVQPPSDPFIHNVSPAPYSLRNLTPEIINPDAQSRSRFGTGADGRSGVLIRPLGALPAPATPPPQATPYEFTPSPPTAIPARSPEMMVPQLGSRADIIPRSVLGQIVTPGSPEEQAASRAIAQLGSTGAIVPRRLFMSSGTGGNALGLSDQAIGNASTSPQRVLAPDLTSGSWDGTHGPRPLIQSLSPRLRSALNPNPTGEE